MLDATEFTCCRFFPVSTGRKAKEPGVCRSRQAGAAVRRANSTDVDCRDSRGGGVNPSSYYVRCYSV